MDQSLKTWPNKNNKIIQSFLSFLVASISIITSARFKQSKQVSNTILLLHLVSFQLNMYTRKLIVWLKSLISRLGNICFLSTQNRQWQFAFRSGSCLLMDFIFLLSLKCQAFFSKSAVAKWRSHVVCFYSLSKTMKLNIRI